MFIHKMKQSKVAKNVSSLNTIYEASKSTAMIIVFIVYDQKLQFSFCWDTKFVGH